MEPQCGNPRLALNFQGWHAFPRFSLISKAPIASTLGRGRGLETGALKYAKSSLARPPKFLGHRFGGPLCRKNALRSRMSPGDFPRGCRCIRGSLWLHPPPPDGAPVRKSKVPIRKKSALILAMLRSSRFALNFQGFHAFPSFSLTSKAPIASTLARGRGA